MFVEAPESLRQWVQECAALTQPDNIHWCDGSEAENRAIIEKMVAAGMMQPLDQQAYPGSYLCRSAPSDVARVEDRTFICTQDQSEVGPTNHWMHTDEARATLNALFAGSMRGRTLYVIPYVMGPVGSPLSKVGVEITDSPYVVVNMRLMTRMGRAALEQLARDPAQEFVPGLHSVGAPLAPGEKDVPWPCSDEKYICHFPDERLILSYGSGYGGNALLGKKCFALRIASAQARDEGWMAEHMLILELTDPQGETTYFAAAFPSACGKTNLAMLISPLEDEGWSVRTVGDDIAWMRVGDDGRLWAINPEAGFFGVVPGTNERTNPNALATARANTIYTNVAFEEETGQPWWEGKTPETPAKLTDWKGRAWTPDSPDPAAHPNSRFTAPAAQCPAISPRWEDPQGVPISGIIFGGRRNTAVPLVAQAYSWPHGVFMGATMGSRTTAAAFGAQDVLRRDPMAMLPFCGYHMGDYFAHWLEMGKRLTHPPAIFQVNWFRRDAGGAYLWPGFGDNVRALIWMRERIRGEGRAVETPIGYVPTPDGLNLSGLNIAPDRLKELLRVDPAEWQDEAQEVETHFARFGDRLPQALREELTALRARLAASRP